MISKLLSTGVGLLEIVKTDGNCLALSNAGWSVDWTGGGFDFDLFFFLLITGLAVGGGDGGKDDGSSKWEDFILHPNKLSIDCSDCSPEIFHFKLVCIKHFVYKYDTYTFIVLANFYYE